MEGQNFSENYSYMECIQSVANFFKEGKYTATLMALKNIERNYFQPA